MSVRDDYDAVVIGAGPAGCAASIELARKGATVLLVERRSFPRSKVCGGCLGPMALRRLDRLGLDAAALEGSERVEQIRVAIAGARTTIELPHGIAVDRSTLDAALLARARCAGAQVHTETRGSIGEVRTASREVHLAGSVGGVTHAGIVIDGSGLRGSAGSGSEAGTDRRLRVGLGASAVSDVGPGLGEVWMASDRRGYVGLARFGGGVVNAAASVRADALAGSRPGELVDSILERAGLAPLRWSDWSGTRPLRAQPPVALRERVLPVGDAAGFWEPFTGEGIGWALESGIGVASAALELGPAWSQASAEAWLRERRRWSGRAQAKSRMVAALSSRPQLARAALAILRRLPAAGRLLIPDEATA